MLAQKVEKSGKFALERLALPVVAGHVLDGVAVSVERFEELRRAGPRDPAAVEELRRGAGAAPTSRGRSWGARGALYYPTATKVKTFLSFITGIPCSIKIWRDRHFRPLPVGCSSYGSGMSRGCAELFSFIFITCA